MRSIYKRLLKRALLSTLIIHLSLLSYATTYYVSNAGNDSNSGLASTLAWKTLVKVNSFTFRAGDQILFERGSSFYGSLTVKYSGASGSPIVFGAYGTGANPVITGFTQVTAWTNLGSNIWESTNAVSALSTLDMVVINNVNTPMGRIPNSGYYYFQSHSDNYHITSNSLSGTPNWTGAELALNANYYETKRCPITAQSGSTLTFTQPEPFSIYTNGLKFIIQNDIRTLDTPNEWYYNPTTKKISVYSTSQPTNVKVATTDNLVTISAKDYITFDGIDFTGANSKAFSISASDYITIQNCNISFSGRDAIYGPQAGTADRLTVDNCTIIESNNGAIGLPVFFTNATFSNNSITNSGMVYGATTKLVSSTNNAGIAYGISAIGSGSTFENNVITNSGYVGIRYLGSNVTVQNNYIYKFCQNQHDGGGLYTWNGSNTSYSGTLANANIIINELVNTDQQDGQSGQYDACIYLDNYSNGITISGNTMANSGIGLFLINSHEVTVSDNVVYNNDKGIRYYTLSGSAMANLLVTGNQIIAKSASQIVAYADEIEDIKPYLTANNNIYARPIDDNVTFKLVDRSIGAVTYAYNFEQWKTFSGKDASSTKSPQSISNENDLQFEYNASNTTKSVSLPDPMIDVKGTKYVGSVTLQPYTSVVLMKDANPDLGDVNAPIITSFTIPATSTSLTISVSGLSASDNVGVTGYLLTETSTKPYSTATGWTLTKPTSYTFTSTGTKSLYAWAKDAAGNVSASLKADVAISAPTATAYTLTGPSSGNVNTSSANFSVTPNNLYTGSITITPSGSGSAGLSIKVITFTNSSATQTFTITPTVAGSITLTATNNGSLVNPSNLNYTVNATVPGAPTTVTAIAGNTTATVTFVAPLNNGGTSDLTYTVTSIPAGGNDINAGTASLSHTITGLTNGTSYTFTVKATNIAGTSVSSTPSNSVTPVAISSTEYQSICDGSSYNGWTVTGKYQRTLIAKSGGDSIVTTYLTVNPKYSVTEDITINSGESYNGWTATGQYIRTLSSISGCDSIVTTNLTVVVNSGKQGQIPSHFVPVWQGQTGTNLMNFVINSAVFEDMPLGAEDEIGVFSGSICVGAGKLAQAINPADQGTYLSFQASQNTGTNNGYILNDTIIFKIWDTTNQLERSVQLVNYQSGIAPVITTGRFSSLATVIVSMVSYIEYSQTISLKQGNNMFSTYIVPNNPDLSKVVKSLCDLGQLYKIQDEAGLSFEYWGSYGGWINKIGNVAETESYNINVTADCALTIKGRMVSLPLNIPLKRGWNFISFPVSGVVNAMSVVQSLIDLNKLVKVQDEAGNSIEKLKKVGWVNNIGNFIPGKGYKVYVSSNTSLTIQENYPKSANMLAETSATEYFHAQYEGNGISHMNINMIGLAESGLAEGDELAAFDGEICVGTLKITEEHLLAGTASLISSYSTKVQNKDGFTNGDQILLYAWNKSTGEKTEVHAEVVDGALTFAQNASVLISMNNLTTGTNYLSEEVTIDVYPNPSRGNFTVRLNELLEMGNRIEILDNTGRLIATRQITNQSEAFNLDNPTSGLYFVKTTLGTKSEIHKLIVNK